MIYRIHLHIKKQTSPSTSSGTEQNDKEKFKNGRLSPTFPMVHLIGISIQTRSFNLVNPVLRVPSSSLL